MDFGALNPAMLGQAAEALGNADLNKLAQGAADAYSKLTPQQEKALREGAAGLLTSGAGTLAANLLTSGKQPSALDLMNVAKTAGTGIAAGMGAAGAAPGGQSVADTQFANAAKWLAKKATPGSQAPATPVAAPVAQAAAAGIPTAVPVAAPPSTPPRAMSEVESKVVANLAGVGMPIATAVALATAGAVRLPEEPSLTGALANAFSGAGRRTYRKRKDKKKTRKGRRTPRKAHPRSQAAI